MTDIEKWITSVMQAVENGPADPRLTECVTLLASARERYADFVDGVPPLQPKVEKKKEQLVPKGLHGLTLNGTHFETVEITGDVEPDTLFYANILIGGNTYFVRYDGIGNLCVPSEEACDQLGWSGWIREIIAKHPDVPGLNLFRRRSRMTSELDPVFELRDQAPVNFDLARFITGRIVASLQGTRGEVQQLIAEEGLTIVDTLLRKNKDYGSSVFEPPELDHTISPEVGLFCRLSDKIRRIRQLRATKTAEVAESLYDSIADMGGYSILLLVFKRLESIAKGKKSVSISGVSDSGCSSDPGVPGHSPPAGQLPAEDPQHQQQ